MVVADRVDRPFGPDHIEAVIGERKPVHRAVEDRDPVGQAPACGLGREAVQERLVQVDRGHVRAGFLGQQPVAQGGLARSGGAEQHDGAGQDGGQGVQDLPGHGAGGQHVHPGSHLGHLVCRRLRVGARVGRGEHHERLGAALPGQGEHAFGPAMFEWGGQRHRHHHRVDVGGQDLAVRNT